MGGPGVNHNLQTPCPLPFPTQTPELGAQTDPPPLSLWARWLHFAASGLCANPDLCLCIRLGPTANITDNTALSVSLCQSISQLSTTQKKPAGCLMRKWQWYSEGKSEILLINGTNSWFHSHSGGQHGLKKVCMSLETLLCLPMWFPFIHNKQDTIITFYRLKYFRKTVRLSLKMCICNTHSMRMQMSNFSLDIKHLDNIWLCLCKKKNYFLKCEQVKGRLFLCAVCYI